MKATSQLSSLAAICLLPLILADPASYSLYHRFVPSPRLSLPTPNFEHYGDISVDFEAQRPVAQFSNADNRDPMVDDGEGMYQLGLKVGDEMLLTTTKSCYTAAPQVYTFVLHLPDTHSPPTSLDLKLVGGVPTSGACPKNWIDPGDRLFLPKGIATAVEVRLPNRIEGPVLAPPPTVDTSTGQPKPPEVEKTFFQKYWIAIIGVGFFAFSLLGPQPEGGQRGGGGR